MIAPSLAIETHSLGAPGFVAGPEMTLVTTLERLPMPLPQRPLGKQSDEDEKESNK